MKLKDLSGNVYGKWTVLRRAENAKGKKTMWLCMCKCGIEQAVYSRHLTSGMSRGCRKCASKHGMTNSPEFISWSAMKERCLNKNHISYHRYGGRGITVCDRWVNSFENFYKDMGERPEGCSLDRIDNNGNYSPENCKWSTIKEQSNNTEYNKIVKYSGNTYTLKQLAEMLNINYQTLYSRVAKGTQADIEVCNA